MTALLIPLALAGVLLIHLTGQASRFTIGAALGLSDRAGALCARLRIRLAAVAVPNLDLRPRLLCYPVHRRARLKPATSY